MVNLAYLKFPNIDIWTKNEAEQRVVACRTSFGTHGAAVLVDEVKTSLYIGYLNRLISTNIYIKLYV